jgi:hypothetical protein
MKYYIYREDLEDSGIWLGFSPGIYTVPWPLIKRQEGFVQLQRSKRWTDISNQQAFLVMVILCGAGGKVVC